MSELVITRIIRKNLSVFFLFVFMLSISVCYSQDKELLLAQGKDAYRNKNYSTAIYIFDKLIQLDSKFWIAYIERATVYLESGEYKKALDDYNLVLKNTPDNPRCYVGMAQIYEVFYEDNYKAIELYTRSIELNQKINDTESVGNNYFLRGVLKKKIGDRTGYLKDLQMGASLNNYSCKSTLELEELVEKLKK